MDNIKDRILSLAPGTTVEEAAILTVMVPSAELRVVMEYLKTEMQFDYLQDIVGMDWGESLGVIYRLFTVEDNQKAIVVKTSTTDKENPELFSVADLWESANLYEREVYDFFGVKFINHPGLRRLFLRGNWQGYPLRKDYDTSLNPLTMENQTMEEMENTTTINLTDKGIVQSNFQLFGEKEYIINMGLSTLQLTVCFTCVLLWMVRLFKKSIHTLDTFTVVLKKCVNHILTHNYFTWLTALITYQEL